MSATHQKEKAGGQEQSTSLRPSLLSALALPIKV